MKKAILCTVISIFVIPVLFAQAPPRKMSYQLVVRDANNELVVNSLVGLRISILEDNINGVTVFAETHSATTNTNALATVELGTGTLLVGTNLADIDWAHHDYFISAEIDPAGGNNYTITGKQQLLTVPYAYYSGKTAYFDYNDLDNKPKGNNTGDILYWDASDTSWHIIPVGSAGQVLTLNPNGVPQWYSNILNQNTPPTIVTDSVFDINGYTMSVHATITSAGSTGIIESGVCWSNTNPSPSIGNNHTVDGSSIGGFTSFVSGLKSNTKYYVCAYATNSVGTSYGNVITITTPTHCGTITDIDGNTYNTVYIGRQCWMKENLRTKTYADGIPISGAIYTTLSLSTYEAHNTGSSNPTSCYYYSNNDTASVAIFGLLYTWPAVMKGAGSSNSNPSGILGVCPFGWHVPSCAEWCELENFLNTGIDMNCSNTGWRGTMAKMMSKPKYWSADAGNSFFPGYWTTDSTDFNTTGFSMIPNGYRYNTSGSNYYNTGYSGCTGGVYHTHYAYPTSNKTAAAYFWTSVSGTYRQFSSSQTGSYYGTGQATTSAMSVRCVKDYN